MVESLYRFCSRNQHTCLDLVFYTVYIEHKNPNNILSLDILHEFRKTIETSGITVFYNAYYNDELEFVLKPLLYDLIK